jgi:hypothetical protein
MRRIEIGALALFAACALLGGIVFAADLFWPPYFPLLRAHVWLGLGSLLLVVPAMAAHLSRTGLTAGGASVALAFVLMLPLPLLITWAPWLKIPLESHPPLILAGLLSGGMILAIAALTRVLVSRRDRPKPPADPTRWTWTGLILLALGLEAAWLGVLIWLLPGGGDLRNGGHVYHSLLGVLTILMVIPHLRLVLKRTRRAWTLVLIGALLAGGGLVWKHQYFEQHMRSRFAVDQGSRWTVTTLPFDRAGRARADGPHLTREQMPSAQTCGSAGCHELLTHQWEGSAHRFAADNDFYRRVVAEFVAERGVAEAAFCAACHDPVRVVTGEVAEAYKDGAPPPGEGVTCVACHGAYALGEGAANGSFKMRGWIEYPGKDEAARHRNIRLDPRFHSSAAMVDGFHTSGPSCGPCHRLQVSPDMGATVSETVQVVWHPQPDLDFTRQRAEVLEGSSPEGFDPCCVDCHLPDPDIKDGDDPWWSSLSSVYDHHMPGLNRDLALYASHPDADPRALDEVRRRVLRFRGGAEYDRCYAGRGGRPTSYEALEPAPGEAVAEQPGPPHLAVRMRPGHSPREFVLVATTSNRAAGHSFPTGPFDLREVWQEVLVTDGTGQLLLHVGGLEEGGRVDPLAHRLGATELDSDGGELPRHRIWDLGAVVDKRVIGPTESVQDEYRIPVPTGIDGPLHAVVRWNYRHANPEFVQWVYGDAGRSFPVHTLVEVELELTIPKAESAEAAP